MISRRRAVVAAVTLMAGAALSAVSASAQDSEPTVTLDLTGAKAGDTVLVEGTGWAGTELVYVELCGNGGRNGSSSCDQTGATLAGVSSEGTFGTTLIVAEPPVPCPCVVKATSQTARASATAELAVQDVPVVPLEDQADRSTVERNVEITEARLTGRGPWSSWFGQAAERTLVITVENTGEVAVHDPPLTITVGKGSNPSGVVGAPDLGTLEPGDAVTVEVPVQLGPLAFGEHSARVSVAGFAEPIETTATTTTYPWALLIIAAVLLQLCLLKLRNMTRQRFAADAADDEEAEERLALPAPAPLMLAAASAGSHDTAETSEVPAVDDQAALTTDDDEAPIPLAVLAADTEDTEAPAALDVETPIPVAADVDQTEAIAVVDVETPMVLAAVLAADTDHTSDDDVVDEPARTTDGEAPIPVAAVLAADTEDISDDDEMADSGTDDPPAISEDDGEAATESDEPVVIDLRDAPPEPEPEPTPDVIEPASPDMASPDMERHLPNPFDQSSDARVIAPVALASRRRSEARPAPASIQAQRQAAQRAVDEAHAHAATILAAAAARAQESAVEAEATRAEAAATLDEARLRVVQLLEEAEAHAQAIRQGADDIHDAIRLAALESRAEVERITTEAVRQMDERLVSAERSAAQLRERSADRRPAMSAEAHQTDRVSTTNGTNGTNGVSATNGTNPVKRPKVTPRRARTGVGTGTGLDAAIQRAVHRAFQG